MTYHYTIQTKLPTLNEYILIERTNKYGAAKIKKEYSDACAVEALEDNLPKLPAGLYDFQINWTTTDNKIDPDNVYFAVKFILDGLVSSGRLQSDGRRCVRNISHTIQTGSKYKIDVFITTV